MNKMKLQKQYLLHSIRWRLPFSYSLIALLTALVLGVVLLTVLLLYYRQRELDYLQSNAHLIADTVAGLLAEPESPDVLAGAVARFAFVTRTRVQVWDSERQLLADSIPSSRLPTLADNGLPELPQIPLIPELPTIPELSLTPQTPIPAELADLPALLPIDDIYGLKLGSSGIGRSRQRVLQPFFHPQTARILGYVELSGGPDYSQGIVAGVAVAWALASLLAVVLAAGAGWQLSRRLSQPLLDLKETTAQMAEGDLSARARIQRPDEIGSLAATFNEMAGRLEAVVAALRRFVADAAHELNTPLTALRNSLDLAVEEKDPAEQLALVQHAQTQVWRLETLARGLLDLSRLEAGTEKREMAAVNLGQLLLKSGEVYAAQAEQAGLRFELALPDSLTPIFVKGDANQLQRALNNLVDNAVKFTPEGGVVALGLAVADGWVTLWVSDTGIGIYRTEVSELFSRFHRGRNATPYPGSGLGLAIVRAIVERHGGQVAAENLSPGARFTIRLPPYETGR